MTSDWESCSFTPASFFLALCYFILLVCVCLYLRALMQGKTLKRGEQKSFLIVSSINNIMRCLFFILWPFYGSSCQPQLTNSDFQEMITLGDLPAAVFLTAFSVLVWTFVRIYHMILRQSVQDTRNYSFLVFFLFILNCAVYVSTFLNYVRTKDDDFFSSLQIELLTAASGILALLFLAYGTKSYLQVKSVLQNNGQSRDMQPRVRRQSVSGTSTTDTTDEDEMDDEDHVIIKDTEHSIQNESPKKIKRVDKGFQQPLLASPIGTLEERKAGVNPMRKIAVVAAICTVCFLLRTVLLEVMDFWFDSQPWYIMIPYFAVAEIIPLALLLYVFNSTATLPPEMTQRAGTVDGGDETYTAVDQSVQGT